MDVVRIAVFGTAAVLFCVLLGQTRPDYAVYLTLAAGLCILGCTVGKLRYLMESMSNLQEDLPLDTAYLRILLKMMGITYVGQFSAGICKDAGYGSIAGQIELFSRLAILTAGMPVLAALLETVHGFLG